jgi:sugar phosphate isomerase/epimerase
MEAYMYSRRDFGKLAAVALPLVWARAAATPAYLVNGIPVGASTLGFRDSRGPGHDNVDAVIAGLKSAGVSYIELDSRDVEAPAAVSGFPKPQTGGAYGGMTVELTPAEQAMVRKANRDALREWRMAAKPEALAAVRDKFEAAGIWIHSYRVDFDDACTDSEIVAVFLHAEGLGVRVVSTATNLNVAHRLGWASGHHNIAVAFRLNPDKSRETIAAPAGLMKAAAAADHYRICLDLGDFTAANESALAFLQENHASISHIIVKDRTRDGGANEEFGSGDAPIKPLLSLLKEKQYKIPVFVQYEYLGLGTPVEEVKKCMAYVRAALA